MQPNRYSVVLLFSSFAIKGIFLIATNWDMNQLRKSGFDFSETGFLFHVASGRKYLVLKINTAGSDDESR